MFASYVMPPKRSLGIKGTRPRTMSTTTTNTASSTTPIAVYLYAGDMIIENVTAGYFYFQDSLGNTSHVTDAAGNLLERYTYSAFGMPYFYNAVGTQLAGSAYGIRHLFQGQLWTQETGLNDYRNRVELPTMGVFLQPDPIGFEGDPVNIYRFCANDPVNRSDPFGLHDLGDDWEIAAWNAATTERVIVKGNPIDDIPFAENPFADPTRFVDAGLFDRWSNASLQEYYSNLSHEFGLREGSVSGAIPVNLLAGPVNLSLNATNSVGSAKPAGRFPSLTIIVKSNVGQLKPPLLRAIAVANAYSRAVAVRSQGHQMFPGTANSSARHQWAARTLTHEVGPTTTRDLGMLNEVEGFIVHDLWNLPSRLRGQTAWAFEGRDIVDNELGIWQGMEDGQ
jgi:RHS repeat-associated protein